MSPLALTLLCLGLGGCAPDTTGREPPNKIATGQASPSTQDLSASRPSIAHVPVGEFFIGSTPGAPGRDPKLEPTEKRVELGPFRIDARPYPGEVGQPARTGVSSSEAAALCAERKGRLCTELEWERACRGPDSSVYATGKQPCRKGSDCVSGFEVEQMGSLMEWTASSFGTGSPKEGQAVARGADTSTPAENRRCARRSAPKNHASVGFRCCYGAPNATSIEEPKLGPAYREVNISLEELRSLLAEDPYTEHLSKMAKLFKPEAARTVLARGPGDTKGFTLTTRAVEWQPTQGSRLLVVAGHSGKRTSFVVAYFLSDKRKILAGSFLMKNEPGPIALAYATSIRPRIHFSGCWGCPGETGKALFREPEEVVFLQP